MVSESAGRIWHQEPTGCGSDLHLSDHDDHQIGLALLRRGTSARPRRHRLKSEAAAFGASSSSAESGEELARPCARLGGIAGSGGGGCGACLKLLRPRKRADAIGGFSDAVALSGVFEGEFLRELHRSNDKV